MTTTARRCGVLRIQVLPLPLGRQVTDGGRPVVMLNELEYIDGEVRHPHLTSYLHQYRICVDPELFLGHGISNREAIIKAPYLNDG